MTRVKGSRIPRVKVVEYSLRKTLLTTVSLVLLVAGGIACSYFYGNKIGMAQQEQALADVEQLSDKLALYQASEKQLEQSLANATLSSNVDKASSEEVRQEVITLKDEIARLSEENVFYRGLMSPNENDSGLTIGSVELRATGRPRAFVYKVVIQQLATRHNVLKGVVSFQVFGREAGFEKTLSLKDVTEIGSEEIKLRFKYFQVIKGELSLPEGFEAEGIEMIARSTGKSPQKTSKRFGWLVEEI
ncbi:MAG: hypothetical protein ACI93R_002448 [Flavobacteriales bacterium]|jgi:hypothetical protein